MRKKEIELIHNREEGGKKKKEEHKQCVKDERMIGGLSCVLKTSRPSVCVCVCVCVRPDFV